MLGQPPFVNRSSVSQPFLLMLACATTSIANVLPATTSKDTTEIPFVTTPVDPEPIIPTYSSCSEIPDSEQARQCAAFIQKMKNKNFFSNIQVFQPSDDLIGEVNKSDSNTLFILAGGNYSINADLVPKYSMGLLGVPDENGHNPRFLLASIPADQNNPPETFLSPQMTDPDKAMHINGIDFVLTGDASSVYLQNFIHSSPRFQLGDVSIDHCAFSNSVEGYNLQELVLMDDVRGDVRIENSTFVMGGVDRAGVSMNCRAETRNSPCNGRLDYTGNRSSGTTHADMLSLYNIHQFQISNNGLNTPTINPANPDREVAAINLLFGDSHTTISGTATNNTLTNPNTEGLAVIIDDPDPEGPFTKTSGQIGFQGNHFTQKQVSFSQSQFPDLTVVFNAPHTDSGSDGGREAGDIVGGIAFALVIAAGAAYGIAIGTCAYKYDDPSLVSDKLKRWTLWSCKIGALARYKFNNRNRYEAL